MKYKVEVKDEARHDISEAAEWYEEKQVGLGERFRENVIKHFEYLAVNPLSHQRKYKENRELLLKKFPYVIVYRLADHQLVIVLAVAHCKQHSSKKRVRK